MYPLKKYRIVLSGQPTPNERRAAAFLREKIMLITGALLPVVSDMNEPVDCEIVVGATTRERADAIDFSRSRQGIWQYIILMKGERLYLTGLGVPDTTPYEYTSAYRYIDDGGQGTVYAAYHFTEDILGYDFLRGDFEPLVHCPGVEIPFNYRFEYTTKALRAAALPCGEGDMMYMLPVTGQLNWNIMSFVFSTKKGKLVVIDGGHPEETEFLITFLSQLSGGGIPIVDAWFLTHLHSDHYGVLTELLSNTEKYNGRIKINKIYHALLPREFYSDISAEKNPSLAVANDTIINSGGAFGCEAVKLAEGDAVFVGDLSFYALHTPECVDKSLLPKMNMNDSSMILRLTVGTQRILFLSDSEWICNRQLLTKHKDEIRADVVQIAHHGCGNVSDECYDAIGAKKYLLQTGNRFYYSDGGEGLNSHNTGMIRTRRYLSRIGIKEICDRNGAIAFKLPINI